MKCLLIFSLHGILWSGYYLCVIFSYGDKDIFEYILLGIYFYAAYLIAEKVIGYKFKSFVLTISSLGVYLCGKFLFSIFLNRF